MWYKTDLMEQILTSESAKQMIDYVSPIYGKSRIGLWLFQVIGLEKLNVIGIYNKHLSATTKIENQ